MDSSTLISDIQNKMSLIQQDLTQLNATISHTTMVTTNTSNNSPLLCGFIYPGAPGYSSAPNCTTNPKQMYRDNNIDMLRPQYFSVNANGTLQLISEDPNDMDNTANGYSAANVADIIKYSSQQLVTVSGNFPNVQQLWNIPTNMNTAVSTLTAFVKTNGLTGIDIDFENFSSWSSTDYINFKRFISYLGNALHVLGKKLAICGPTWDSVKSPFKNWNYADFVSLPVDYITPMVYDDMWNNSAGTPICPLNWLVTWSKMMLSIFSVDRVIIGIPSYGYIGTVGSYNIKTETYSQIIGKAPGAIRDPNSGEMMLTVGNTCYVYNDSVSMNMKKAVLIQNGIKIISVWHLGGNPWFSP